MGKITEQLLQLLNKSTDIEKYRQMHQTNFVEASRSALLRSLKRKSRCTIEQISSGSGIGSVYIAELLSPKCKKTPTRDTLLCILIGMKASLSDIQDVLLKLQYAQLYARNTRDVDIIYGINQKWDVYTIDENLLLPHEEDPLLKLDGHTEKQH